MNSLALKMNAATNKCWRKEGHNLSFSLQRHVALEDREIWCREHEVVVKCSGARVKHWFLLLAVALSCLTLPSLLNLFLSQIPLLAEQGPWSQAANFR